MGFSWTPLVQFVTEIKAAHQNQIKTNIDTVYTDLELSAYGWAYLPVNIGDEILHEHHKEMRDAIDYADDMNYCRAHNTGYDGADDAVDRATVYSGQNTGYDSGYQAGVDEGHKYSVDNDYHSSYHSGQKSGYDSSYNAGVDSSNYITHKSGFESNVQSGENGSYNLDYNSDVGG